MLNWVKKKHSRWKKSRWKSLGKTKGFHVWNSDFIKNVWQVTNIFSGERNVKTFFFSPVWKMREKMFSSSMHEKNIEYFFVWKWGGKKLECFGNFSVFLKSICKKKMFCHVSSEKKYWWEKTKKYFSCHLWSPSKKQNFRRFIFSCVKTPGAQEDNIVCIKGPEEYKT